METTPTASASATAASVPALLSTPEAIGYPNGAIVTTDPNACSIAVLRDGKIRWERLLPGCQGVLDAVVAMDSILYIRQPAALSSFDPEGTPRWTVKLPDPPLPRALSVPATLADSRIAIVATPKRMDVYDRQGTVTWTFSPPSDEVLIAAPVGMKTEGLVLMTTAATYYLSSEGDVHWRVASHGANVARR